MINPTPVRSTFTVVLTWWLILSFVAFFFRPDQLAGSLTRAWVILAQVLISAPAGFVAVAVFIWSQRSGVRKLLKPDEVRGLRCTIGEVPFLVPEPRMSKYLPPLDALPDVPADFYREWMDARRERHPHHVQVLEKLLKIFEAHKDYPAAHKPGGHGGRTLLQHSALCGYLMHVVARTWEWKGKFNGRNKVVLGLRDHNYKFNPADPMTVLIGLAHDIGKIEAFIWEEGKLAGSKHEHDMTGARMLARMPEVWLLPEDDQFAMMMAIAHYHHPMELPLLPDRRAIDDRTVALMELLITVDRQASSVENTGRLLTQEELDAAMLRDVDTGVALSPERIWEELDVLLREVDRIDSRQPRHNVASYCQVKGANTPLLILHEETLRIVLAQRLRVDPDRKLGDGRRVLTIEILKALHEHNALRTSMKCTNAGDVVRHYRPESALWQVGFWKQGKTKNPKFDRITGWVGIIVEPAQFDGLRSKLTPYTWIALVEDGLWGASRCLKAPFGTGGDDTEVDEPDAATGPTAEGSALGSAAAPNAGAAAPAPNASPEGVLANATSQEPSPVAERPAIVAPSDAPRSEPAPAPTDLATAAPSVGLAVETPLSPTPARETHDAAPEQGTMAEQSALQQGDLSEVPAALEQLPAAGAQLQLALPTSITTPEPVGSVAVAPATPAGPPPKTALEVKEPPDALRTASEKPAPAQPSKLREKRPNNASSLAKAFAGPKRSTPPIPVNSLASIKLMLLAAKRDAQARGIAVTEAADGTFALSSEQILLLAPGIEMRALGDAAEGLASQAGTDVLFHWKDRDAGNFFLGLRGQVTHHKGDS